MNARSGEMFAGHIRGLTMTNLTPLNTTPHEEHLLNACPDEITLRGEMIRQGYGPHALRELSAQWSAAGTTGLWPFAEWREVFVSWLSDRWSRETDRIVNDDDKIGRVLDTLPVKL